MKNFYPLWLVITSLVLTNPFRVAFELDSMTYLPSEDNINLPVGPEIDSMEVTSEVFNGTNLDVSISTTRVDLPVSSLDNTTINPNTVKLYNDVTGVEFTNTVVNGTGGGDAITLSAFGLEFSTDYRVEVGTGVQDINGNPLVAPYTFNFTTGDDPGGVPSDVQFEKVTVATNAQYTSLEIGPDGKLYGLVLNGLIHRWTIESDGTLSNMEELESLQIAEDGNRTAIGFTFDPGSTADNLIVWISHTTFGFSGQPTWAGKISRLYGDDLQNVQDVIVGLPRSDHDHLTNSLVFGPDKALYFVQGSNSAMGLQDGTWGNRPERLLSAALLRLDTEAVDSLPLNVRTGEGGTYDPFDPNAPLTFYATGIRNAYDMVWHSNGNLYVPGNGSAGGGNTPGTPADLGDVPQRIDGPYTGGAVPSILGVSESQPDMLHKVVPGKYYGHPNPTRGEYVMNGGNPTAGNDLIEVEEYPVGTMPDQNFGGFAFNFENAKSPNGAIEYQSNTFNGALKGKLLVVRYSAGDDIFVLDPSGLNGDIIEAETGIIGFTSFRDPLDLTENPVNGHIYVAEFGTGELTLLRPLNSTGGAPNIAISGTGPLEFNPGELILNCEKSSTDVQSFTIENTGGDDLIISDISTDDSKFTVSTSMETLLPGESISVDVTFTPAGEVGEFNSTLTITSNDADDPNVTIDLFALSTNGFEGSNEPTVSTILSTTGIDVDPGWTGLIVSTTDFPLGDEILDTLFRKSGTEDVVITPIGRYAPLQPVPFGYYFSNEGNPILNEVGILSDVSPEHQSLFPELTSGSMTFDPGADEFGIYVSDNSYDIYTEDELNMLLHPNQTEHAIRVYPVKNRSGNVVPNTYLLVTEEALNGDYNDFMFVVSNVVPASVIPILRVNASGPLYITNAGDKFEADKPAYLSGTFSNTFKNYEVQNTIDDDLYRTYTVATGGAPFSYSIPVPNSTYRVNLYFSEPFYTEPDRRVFDVTVEGNLVVDDLDLVATAGPFTAHVEYISDIVVSDGIMNIDFSSSENNSLICAIELLGAGSDNNLPPDVTITSPPDNSAFEAGETISFTGTAIDPEDGDISENLSWTSNLDGPLGSGAGFSTSNLSIGVHNITATVTDAGGITRSDIITTTIIVPQENVIYRELFWNESTSNIPLADRGWMVYETGGVVVPGNRQVISGSIGNLSSLQNINAGDIDPTPEDNRGLAVAFNAVNTYFFFTNEHSIDLGSTTIDEINWFQGPNTLSESRVAIQINGQWYVSTATFEGPNIGSSNNFPTQAEKKTFTFSTAAADWQELNFTAGSQLSLGSVLSSDLPTGTITGFGLYCNDANGFTMRFDSYQIEGTPNEGCPIINDIADVSACDAYILPAITGSNLTGNEAYFTGPSGTGTEYEAGETITASTLLYIYDSDGTCSDEESFTITITPSPDVMDLADVTTCGMYVLPAITGTNLTGNEAYYTGPEGAGMQLQPGAEIASTTTVYIFDETGTTPNCFDEESFTVTIAPAPDVFPIPNVTLCGGSYILPNIGGTNLTGNEAYYTGMGGTGMQFQPGAVITSNTTLYIYDETGTTPNCFDEEVFTITIHPVPDPAGLKFQVNDICMGEDAIGEITSAMGLSDGNYTFTYNLNGGSSQTAQVTILNGAGEFAISGLTLTNYTVNLTKVEAAIGCFSNITGVSDGFTVNDPVISISDAGVTEGDAGNVIMSFIVTLSTACTETVSVNYATVNGTATAGEDYVQKQGTLEFNPGDLSKEVEITILGDTAEEEDEIFHVNLSLAIGAIILDGQGTGTILDNDDGVVPCTAGTLVVTNNPSTGYIDPGTYAAEFIISDGTVQTGTEVIFQASEYIELVEDMNPDRSFTVEPGGLFQAEIIECNLSLTDGGEDSVTSRSEGDDASTTTPLSQQSWLKIEPNPATDFTRVSFYLSDQELVNLRLFNHTGQMLSFPFRQRQYGKGEHSFTIYTQQLPAGMYFIQLETSKQRLTEKVMIIGSR